MTISEGGGGAKGGPWRPAPGRSGSGFVGSGAADTAVRCLSEGVPPPGPHPGQPGPESRLLRRRVGRLVVRVDTASSWRRAGVLEGELAGAAAEERARVSAGRGSWRRTDVDEPAVIYREARDPCAFTQPCAEPLSFSVL
jgi:hypothetical protein